MAATGVCVTIVTYNSERYIQRCLETVLAQRGVDLEVVVVDNASADSTREILAAFRGRIRLILNSRNAGFAAAQNQAIRSSSAPWALTLNADVLMQPGFIRSLLDAGEMDPETGSVCGKLLSIGAGFRPLPERLIDSAGLYFTPEMRHFDRGWHEPDGDRFSHLEYVFGASAAAAMYRREMIEDISFHGDFFGPDFFCYREDADVAWRAQLFGWQCIYAPQAEAFHVRTVTPGNRRSLPPAINMHSVKNRFLLRIKNITPDLMRRHWLPMLTRDALVAGGCALSEPRSLEAFWRLAFCITRARAWRRDIMARRRVNDAEIAGWFTPQPAARPVVAHAIPTRPRVFAPAAG